MTNFKGRTQKNKSLDWDSRRFTGLQVHTPPSFLPGTLENAEPYDLNIFFLYFLSLPVFFSVVICLDSPREARTLIWGRKLSDYYRNRLKYLDMVIKYLLIYSSITLTSLSLPFLCPLPFFACIERMRR